MKYGAINIVTTPGRDLTERSAPLERQEEGQTLRSTIQLANSHAQTTLGDITLKDGQLEATTIVEGSVLREVLVDDRTERITADGDPDVTDKGTKVSIAETRFILVPGEVLIMERTGADAARSVIETYCRSEIEPAQIDLQAFSESHPDAKPVLEWGHDRESSSTLCVIGDEGANSELRNRLDPADRAQLSFQGLEWESRSLYGTATESSYIELYRDENGGSVDTGEFVRFVLEEVKPYTTLDE